MLLVEGQGKGGRRRGSRVDDGVVGRRGRLGVQARIPDRRRRGHQHRVAAGDRRLESEHEPPVRAKADRLDVGRCPTHRHRELAGAGRRPGVERLVVVEPHFAVLNGGVRQSWRRRVREVTIHLVPRLVGQTRELEKGNCIAHVQQAAPIELKRSAGLRQVRRHAHPVGVHIAIGHGVREIHIRPKPPHPDAGSGDDLASHAQRKRRLSPDPHPHLGRDPESERFPL